MLMGVFLLGEKGSHTVNTGRPRYFCISIVSFGLLGAFQGPDVVEVSFCSAFHRKSPVFRRFSSVFVLVSPSLLSLIEIISDRLYLLTGQLRHMPPPLVMLYILW